MVQELKNRNFYVSIDSHNTDELIRGSKAGADYLLSIKSETYHILENLDSYPVLIPSDNNLPEFYNLIDRAIKDNLTFIADLFWTLFHMGLLKFNEVCKFERKIS